MKIEETQISKLDALNISKNYELNLEELYFSYINEIDSYRSYTLIDTSITIAKSAPKIASDACESRCHAFYRMIGFPAIASLETYYSPGFANNISNQENKKREIAYSEAKRDKIANIYLAREIYIKKILSAFSKKDLNSALIAKSIVYHVSFNDLLKDESSFNKDLSSYNRYCSELFSDLLFEGTGLIKSYLLDKRPHFIRPFAVSPLIERNVKPGKRMLGIPFIKGGEAFDDTTNVKKTLIEKIIIERLNYSKIDIKKAVKQDNSNEEINKLNAILESVKNDKYIDYNKYVTSIILVHKLMDELFSARKTIQKVLASYNWLPMPSELGFDKGVGVYPNIDLNSDLDREIQELEYKLAIYELDIATKKIEDPSNYVFASVEEVNIVADADLASKSSNLQLNIKQLTEQRQSYYTEANTALVNIERIIGEFSGLGLLDIIVVINSLYSVDMSVLIGLLDSNSIEAMVEDNELKALVDSVEKMDVNTAIVKFEEKVREYYSIAESYYQTISLDKATK